MFNKILVANRGEIAVRIIRACRELGIPAVAVFSDADREALHVALADEAFLLGPAASSESYLRIHRIIESARKSGAEAIHPGYGFLAENKDFALACDQAGIAFIGPSAESIRLMGSKIESRETVRRAGVPLVPGSPGPVGSPRQAMAEAKRIGFPVLVKASAGGGGKGMRVVRGSEELGSAFETAEGEATSAFGDATLYLEKYIERPRHIEVQVLGDRHGNLVHLGERECSIQRRHQKVVEECPSPIVDEAFRRDLGQAALAVASAVRYHSAGTVEFLVDALGPGKEWKFYFLEMNTRLQVEHPVTEMVTGIDLVKEQIRLAAGEELGYAQDDIVMRGAALECRIYAEDPDQNFMPSPGLVETLFEPSGPGVRNESGLYEGFRIPIEYDPLISKLVTYGRDRQEAVCRMRRALTEYKVGGVKTTIPFFKRLFDHADFLAGRFHTHFIDEHGLAKADRKESKDWFPIMAAAVEYVRRDQPAARPRVQTRNLWKDYWRNEW